MAWALWIVSFFAVVFFVRGFCWRAVARLLRHEYDDAAQAASHYERTLYEIWKANAAGNRTMPLAGPSIEGLVTEITEQFALLRKDRDYWKKSAMRNLEDAKKAEAEVRRLWSLNAP